MRLWTGLAVSVCLFGGEQVVLRTGFRLAADRHETMGGLVRLYRAEGVIEIPTEAIERIEQEEYTPPPPAPPAPPVPVPKAAEVGEAGETPPDPETLVAEAARRYGLPVEFLRSVARVESGFQVDAVSPKGAIGLMQLMPATAHRLNANPHDPAENVDAGARHLRDLLIRYNGSTFRALAAYNAGAGAVERYGGIPPYAETRGYVEKVIRHYLRESAVSAARSAPQ